MASGWNLWVWLPCIDVVSVCCCKEVYRYPHNNKLLLFPIYSTWKSSFFAAASLLLCSFKKCFFGLYIIESVDSINRGERGFPLTQYITNGGISRARNTITYFKHHYHVIRLISNRMSV